MGAVTGTRVRGMNSLVCMTIRARSRFEREIIRTLDGSEPARASSLRCEVVDDYQRQIRILRCSKSVALVAGILTQRLDNHRVRQVSDQLLPSQVIDEHVNSRKSKRVSDGRDQAFRIS